MPLYGYARVSTTDQDLSVQETALRAAGCEVIRTEKKSGSARVFNAGQVEGYATAEPAAPLPSSERLACAETFHQALGIATVHGAEMAHYRISEGAIHMPAFERFYEPVGYYGTLLHEAAHATVLAFWIQMSPDPKDGSINQDQMTDIVMWKQGLVVEVRLKVRSMVFVHPTRDFANPILVGIDE